MKQCSLWWHFNWLASLALAFVCFTLSSGSDATGKSHSWGAAATAWCGAAFAWMVILAPVDKE